MLGIVVVAHKLTDWSLNSNWILLPSPCAVLAVFFFLFFTRPFGCCRSTLWMYFFFFNIPLSSFFSLLVRLFLAAQSKFWIKFGAAFRGNPSSDSSEPKREKEFLAKNPSLKLASQKPTWIRTFAFSSRQHVRIVHPLRKSLCLSNMMCLNCVWDHLRLYYLIDHRIKSFRCPCIGFCMSAFVVRTIESKTIFYPIMIFSGLLSIFHSTWHLNLSICTFFQATN